MRKMLHEIHKRMMNLRVGDQVIVVEDQEKQLCSICQGITEHANLCFGETLTLVIT
jgi:hypothetical protein